MRIHDVVDNPYIPGHSLLKPFCALRKAVCEAFQGVKEAIEEAGFLCRYRHLIPTPATPCRYLNCYEISRLFIRNDTYLSERLSLKGMVFTCNHLPGNNFELTATQFPPCSPTGIVIKESLKRVAKLVGWVALAILTLPLILPLTLVGLA